MQQQSTITLFCSTALFCCKERYLTIYAFEFQTFIQIKAYDSAICVFERSNLLEAKALAVQGLLKINRMDLAL